MMREILVDGVTLQEDTSQADTLRLILGDQLNPHHSWYREPTPEVLYLITEQRSETDIVLQHIQKLVGVFGAMRRFAAALRSAGHRVSYLSINNPDNAQEFVGNLARVLGECGARRLELQEPEDYRVRHLLEPERLAAELSHRVGCGIEIRMVSAEHFLVERSEIDSFLPGSKRPVMEYFYRRVRRHYHWLVKDDGSPEGGQWNFDKENRTRWSGPPRDPEPPSAWLGERDLGPEYADILSAGIPHFGETKHGRFPWPVTRDDALRLLEYFCDSLLPRFGTYQDAMHHEQRTLFHSRLSFALNVKLLSPREVIDTAIAAWRSSADAGEPGAADAGDAGESGGGNSDDSDPPAGISEIEGFIRQIAGWREYMRAMYWRLMPELATGELSTLDADRPLPSWYWTGNTEMACLRHVILQSLEDAYAHHIQRLMVTGTFALLAGVNPREVDAWYYGIYIDAFDWVEKPNTLGMSQFADGGRIATKPYAASARYMQRQSSYCGLCSYDPGTREEENSCPFNALFWDFYARNPGLRENRRISFVYPQLDKMGDLERTRLRRRAAWIRDNLDEL